MVTPELQIVPMEELPPTMPLADHWMVEPAMAGAIAANCTVEPAQIDVLLGETLTCMEGAVIVTDAELEEAG